MSLPMVLLAVTVVAVVVISVVAVIVSTSKGAEWGESLWREPGGDDSSGPDQPPE